MSNATKSVTRQEIKITEDGPRLGNPTVAAATTHYAGVFIGTDSSGYAKTIDDTAGMWLMGYLNTGADVQLTTNNTANQFKLPLSSPKSIRSLTAASVAASDFGKPVFISDNQTVSQSPGTFGNGAGWISSIPDTGSVFFNPVVNPRGSMFQGQYRGIRTLAETGAETLTYLDLNKIILVPNSAAKAVTLPPDASVAYGDRIMFIKTHASDANAITLTQNGANIDGATTYAGMDAHHDSVELMFMGGTIGWCRVGGIIH